MIKIVQQDGSNKEPAAERFHQKIDQGLQSTDNHCNENIEQIYREMRPTIDSQKLASLPTANQMLDVKYGNDGSSGRKDFDAKAQAWYYAEVLKDARKEAGMTQKQLAEKIGKKREYVAQLEKGETDMQLSTFLMISEAVGLHLSLSR